MAFGAYVNTFFAAALLHRLFLSIQSEGPTYGQVVVVVVVVVDVVVVVVVVVVLDIWHELLVKPLPFS